MQTIIVGDTTYEFPDGMSDKDMSSAIDADLSSKVNTMPPIEGAIDIPPGLKEMKGGIRGLMETGGALGGGLLGGAAGTLVAPGPGTFGGAVLGETGGYVAGKRGANYLLGEPQDSGLRDVAEGAAYSLVPRAVATGAKALIRQIPASVAEKLYRSAAKLPTVMKPETVKKVLDSAFKNRVQVGPGKYGQDRLAGVIDDYLGFVDDAIAQNKGKFVERDAVVDKINELIPEFADMPVARPYLNTLTKMRDQFIAEKPAQISVETAQNIKRKAWAELQSYFAKTSKINPSRATIVGEKFNLKVGEALKEGLEQKIPELKAANKELGGALELQVAIDRAVGRISNKDILSIMDPLMVNAASSETWGPGLKAMIARRLLEWPRFKSILAIEIANAGKQPLLKATPGAAAVPVGMRNLLDNRQNQVDYTE